MSGSATAGDPIPAAVRAEIVDRLRAVEGRDHVRILLAVESGSRAWGFPSPDSDYDARFIYVRPAAWYVSVLPGRDVIEEPLAGEIDINGWDLRKALGLMLKGNAVLTEWLMSPIIYAAKPDFREGLLSLASTALRPAALLHHYLNLGRSMRRNDAFKGASFPIKKYFYTLRPAVALRWLRLQGYAALPPMHLPSLAAESDLDGPVAAILSELIASKTRMRELGTTDPIPDLERFINEEFAMAERSAADLPAPARLPREAVDAFLRHWVFDQARG